MKKFDDNMKKGIKRSRIYFIALIIVVTMDLIMLGQISNYESVRKDSRHDHHKMQELYHEVLFFPVAAGTDSKLTFGFVDTWMADRTFGGDRQHEGCDIIPSVDKRGICPVVSMTDGVIEKLGWLQLGGYRIGIRSPGGNYYYYAHMESYAENLQEGTEVFAGQFLGFVGDSGYGEEGTTGQFVTHLHIGIYVPDENGEDQAVNPYPVLEKVREHMIRAKYPSAVEQN